MNEHSLSRECAIFDPDVKMKCLFANKHGRWTKDECGYKVEYVLQENLNGVKIEEAKSSKPWYGAKSSTSITHSAVQLGVGLF